jgi:hypothetical protein
MAIISVSIYGGIGLFNEFTYFYVVIMTQEILVILTLLSALFFLGRKFYHQFFTKKKSCEGCAVAKSIDKNLLK